MIEEIRGHLALRARAQSLADAQNRVWFVVDSPGSPPYATSSPDRVRTGGEVSKLIPNPSRRR